SSRARIVNSQLPISNSQKPGALGVGSWNLGVDQCAPVAETSVDDQRGPAVERSRGFLRAVVLQALLAVARNGQPLRIDTALRQIIPNRGGAPLAQRFVVFGTPLRARISLDVKIDSWRIVQRLEGDGQRPKRVRSQRGRIEVELHVGEHA